MSLHKARIKSFEEVLEEDTVDITKLRQLAFHGIPEEKGLRSFVWKILLNYLPWQKSAQAAELAKKRELYQSFIKEIVALPVGPPSDHPLNVNPDSSWNIYFKDNEVLLQIDKDVRRLCPDINFFQTATEFPCDEIVNSNEVKRLHRRIEQTSLNISTMERKGLGVSKLQQETHRSDSGSGDYCPLREGSEAHWEVVERMLFIYAKLNPGLGYVQGMNEIIGPIYHTFACDPVVEFRQHAEADCFFCFTNLMAEIRDFFIRTLDEAESGINTMMDKFHARLHKYDFDVWRRMQIQDLRPQYYSFSALIDRWLTLLLSQEFALPEVERIWDSLFSDADRFNMLVNTCCAMIVLVRDYLLIEDFSSNVKMLQHYPLSDISMIMNKAIQIQLSLE